MSWLTATVMQYIAGALLIACIVLGVRGCNAASDRDVARAERDAATTERDAWAVRAAGCETANAAYGAVLDQLEAAQAERDRHAAQAAQEAAAQVKAAQADAQRAGRALDDYKRRFAARPATCKAALRAVDAACPDLEGY